MIVILSAKIVCHFSPYFRGACGRSVNSDWLKKHYENPFIVNWATHFRHFALDIQKVPNYGNFRVYLAPIDKATYYSG
jgi:hypothetical protein